VHVGVETSGSGAGRTAHALAAAGALRELTARCGYPADGLRVLEGLDWRDVPIHLQCQECAQAAIIH
jgi:hypothetical protein